MCDFPSQDAAGSVKLWEVTRGIVIEDYGKVALVILICYIFSTKIDRIAENSNQCFMGTLKRREKETLDGRHMEDMKFLCETK